jgi:hypothetical protein
LPTKTKAQLQAELDRSEAARELMLLGVGDLPLRLRDLKDEYAHLSREAQELRARVRVVGEAGDRAFRRVLERRDVLRRLPERYAPLSDHEAAELDELEDLLGGYEVTHGTE